LLDLADAGLGNAERVGTAEMRRDALRFESRIYFGG
jgi:hypothetical protein